MRLFVQRQGLTALLLLLLLSGCISRTHRIDRRDAAKVLQEATLQDLVEKINREAAKVRTLNATVDIATSVGGEKKGKVTEYQEIRGYVLVRKPAEIRMIGLFPVVRNKAFDMVSNGESFRLSIPPKNRFVIGKNEIEKPSEKPLENLRPQHIFDALLLQAVDPANEIAVMEASTEVVREADSKKEIDQPTYIVNVLHRGDDRVWFLSRKIIFSRSDLLPHRQIVYDKTGNIATAANYEGFTDYDGVLFPSIIQINRPQEEYSITLKMVKLKVNDQLTDEQFALEQPEGSVLVRVGEKKPEGKGDSEQ